MTTSPVAQTAKSVNVPRERLLSITRTALERHGTHTADALHQANALVEGELRGHPSHGLRRLPLITQRIDRGLIDVTAKPQLMWRADASLEADGKYGFGPVVLDAAITAATDKARSTGISLAAISRSSHIGMLAPYVERIAESGYIGILLTTSEALVHAWGGRSRIVGTNPIGIGMPTGKDPLVLDMSTSQVSMGKIIDYAAKNQPLPSGWAINRQGQPTTVASEAADMGAISPFGGPKGYALALAIESIVATLTKSAYGAEVLGTLDAEHPVSKGDTLIVVSLEALGVEAALPFLSEYLERVRGSGHGDDSVDIPGDRSRRIRRDRIENGVPIDSSVWARARRLSER